MLLLTSVEGTLPAAPGADITAAENTALSSGCFCFPGDTLVDTPRGKQAIASLHVGDLVQAEDPTTGKVEAEPIQAVIDDGIKPLLQLSLSDQDTIYVQLTEQLSDLQTGYPNVAAIRDATKRHLNRDAFLRMDLGTHYKYQTPEFTFRP